MVPNKWGYSLWDLSRSETSSNFFTLSDWYWMEITYRKQTHIRLYLCHPYSNHYSKYTQFQSFRRVSGHERLLSSAFQPSNDSHYSHYAMILWLSYPSECVQNALVTWHSSWWSLHGPATRLILKDYDKFADFIKLSLAFFKHHNPKERVLRLC